jgi:multisubunit Na+/H+ antiporter MnhG subunit
MFGISPLGWLHTLGSLPAIPLAIYMLVRYGRIERRTVAGTVYLVSMLIGAATIFLFAHQPVSYGIAIATIVFLLIGYSAEKMRVLGRAALYVETICLSLTAFLLMVPTVSETLRRVPDGHPFVTDLKSPLLLGAQGGLFLILVLGLTAQLIYLRKQRRSGMPA